MASAEPKRGVIAEPVFGHWYRGRAKWVADSIVIAGKDIHEYAAPTGARVGLELARASTPDAALAFVNAYGVLTLPAILQQDDAWKDREWNDRDVPLPDFVQPYAEFESAAEGLRRILRAAHELRKAYEGDAVALQRVTQDDAEAVRRGGLDATQRFGAEAKKRLMFWRASGRLVDAFEHVLDGASPVVIPGSSPGYISLGLLAKSLLQYCYLSVAHELALEPIARCQGCQAVYRVDDPRQKFCSRQCADRARFRRFSERRKDQKDAKATRSRRR